MKKSISVLVATMGVTLLALASTAVAAEPTPFGITCVPKASVRFCEDTDLSKRVPMLDGVPIDADVTIPGTGDGPWPTIVMPHGFGGDKTNYETDDAEGTVTRNGRTSKSRTAYHYNNIFYAQQGFVVVTYSARGWAGSCGARASRTAGCERGWLHLGDQRYEVRDIQHMMGLLVDAGIAKADGLAVTGISYGGGQTNQLAMLKNRVRDFDGSYKPWTSPNGTPLSLAAAWSRWGWSDMIGTLLPNGRFLSKDNQGIATSSSPIGVKLETWVNTLAAAPSLRSGFVAPVGADRTADLVGWKQQIDKGEPYGPAQQPAIEELRNFHSAVGIAGNDAAPLLAQSGWTDDLFPARESIRLYNRLRAANPKANVALQFSDGGHTRGTNKLPSEISLNDQGLAFLKAHTMGAGGAPVAGSVRAFTQTCPTAVAPGGPIEAPSFGALHPGAVTLAQRGTQSISSDVADVDTGLDYGKLEATACQQVKAGRKQVGAAELNATSKGVALIGLPVVTAKIKVSGKNQGQIAARLWDVGKNGQQTLVTRGVYRTTKSQRGGIVFQLNGNAYTFKRGNRIRLELLGGDSTYLRPSNGSYKISVSNLKLELPVSAKPNRESGVTTPKLSG